MGDGIDRSYDQLPDRSSILVGPKSNLERGEQQKIVDHDHHNETESLDIRMQLIVESGESKMLRQRQQQQQHLQQQHHQRKPGQVALLKQLKSPSFARNTLDEDCLQKLASKPELANEIGPSPVGDDSVTNRPSRLIVGEDQIIAACKTTPKPEGWRKVDSLGLIPRKRGSEKHDEFHDDDPAHISDSTLGGSRSRKEVNNIRQDLEQVGRDSMMIRMFDEGQESSNCTGGTDIMMASKYDDDHGDPISHSEDNFTEKEALEVPPGESSGCDGHHPLLADKVEPHKSAHRDSCSSKLLVVSSPESLLNRHFRQQLQLGELSSTSEEPSYQHQRQQHSTYMLPILLNHKRMLAENSEAKHNDDGHHDDYNNHDDGEDGDEDEDGHGFEGEEQEDEELGPQDSVSFESSGLLGDLSSNATTTDDSDKDEEDEDEDETRAETARLLATPKAASTSTGLHSKPKRKEVATNRMIIPNSASSPSALSTPTNDRDCCNDYNCIMNSLDSREKWLLALGGCGGPCCSRQAELIKLASENAALSRRLFNVSGAQQTSNVASVAAEPHSKGVVGSPCRQAADHQRPGRYNEQEGRKARISSNPLDRLRIFGDSGSGQAARQEVLSCQKRPTLATVQPVARLRQQLQPERLATNRRKRHSIISIFTPSSTSSSSMTANSSSGCQTRRRLSSLVGGSGGRQATEASKMGARGPRNSLESALQFHRRHKQQPGLKKPQQQQQQQTYDPLIPESGFKIVVMGTSGSGKTAIIQRFLYDSFNKRHVPTVEDTYFIEFPHMKNLINISISDTSGTYQFPAMRKLAINSGDAFILVYSVDDPKSFDDLEQLRQTILEQREQAYLEASCGGDSIMSMADSYTSGLGSSSLNNSSASIVSNPTTSSKHNYPAAQPIHYPGHHNDFINMAVTAGDPQALGPHRSLASLFQPTSQHRNQQANHRTNQQGSFPGAGSLSSGSSADNSRRSSVSAAEAALRTRRTRRPPIVVVANKHDLPDERHLVNSDEIEALTVIDWNNGFVRASAALNLNISEIFQEVLRQARQPPTITEAIVSKRRKSLPPKLL